MAVREVLEHKSVLQAEVAALNKLLAVQERVVIDQSAKLEQMLQEARAAQQRWQSTFNASPVGLLLMDENTVIIAVNDVAARLAGRICAEMVNRQPGDALGCLHALEHPGGCGRSSSCGSCPIRALVEDALKTGQRAHGLEVQPVLVVRGVQVKPWLEISVEPAVIAARRHLIVSIADITWRKQAEEALRQSEERFRVLFESSRDAIMTGAPPSGRFTSGNPASLAMFRAKNEQEFLLHGPGDLSPERQPGGRLSAEKAAEMIETAMRKGTHFFEWTHKRLDGEEFPANVLLTRVEQAGKAFILATVRDITDHRRAEQALRDSEQRYASVVDNIAIGVALISPEMEILSLNRQMREWFPDVDPGSKPVCYNAFNNPPRDAPCDYCPTRLTLQDGQTHESITETPAGDRMINFRVVSSAIHDEKGKVVAAIEMVQDITASRQAEERQKRYAADLARANEEVKQFAYIVSHDFRAPLVNLKGFAGEICSSLSAVASALETARPHLGEEQWKAAATALKTDIPESLHFIETAASSMDNYVNALLKLSRLGRQELHPERLCVAEIVENALKGLAHQISARGVKVTVGELPEVIADRTAMQQIMGNVLTNAVLYLDPSRPGRIEIGGSRGAEETDFFVRDNGRGIAPEDMPKVFAPFRRAGKQDVKGEGMGLAYVRTLVRRHGGEIRCESQLGVGTTLTFTFRNSIEKGEHDGHNATDRA